MAQARIIDGKAFAADLRARVAEEVAGLKAEHGLTPGLAVVLVGEDPASQVYVRNKGEQTEAAGMHSETHRLPEATTQDELLAPGAPAERRRRRSTASWSSCRCPTHIDERPR